MRALSILALAAALSATAAHARDQDEPAAGRDPDARDVAMTPVTDLNLAKDEIPPVLLAASNDPYLSEGLDSCPAIANAISMLDAALGPDMDVSVADADRLSTGQVAKSLVASFIPFRGVLRELTGANAHQREFEAAVYAGSVRRGFLKGIGQQKGCAYPARPAFARVNVAEPAVQRKGKTVETAAATIAEPVVQPLPQTR